MLCKFLLLFGVTVKVAYATATGTAAQASGFEPFYQQIAGFGGAAVRVAIDPYFQRLKAGDNLLELSDEQFKEFATIYLHARKLFKDSFSIVGSFNFSEKAAADGGMPMVAPKHDILANIPLAEMDALLLRAHFARCDALTDDSAKLNRNLQLVRLVVPEGQIISKSRSNLERGSLIFDKELAEKICNARQIPKFMGYPSSIFYYKETAGSGRYRILCTDDQYRVIQLAKHPYLGAVFLGDIQAASGSEWGIADLRDADYQSHPKHPDFYHYGKPKLDNGVLFDRNGNCFTKSGLVLIPGKPFSHCYLLYDYYWHQEAQQMCLEQRAIFTKQSFDIPGIAHLINAFGGFETVDAQGLGFIAIADDATATQAPTAAQPDFPAITAVQARMLLPYLYLAQEEFAGSSAAIVRHDGDDETFAPTTTAQEFSTVDTAINYLENILTDQPEMQLPVALPASVASAPQAAAPKPRTKRAAAPRLTPEQQAELQRQALIAAKAKKLEGIRTYFRRQAEQLKHHSMEQANAVIVRMYQALGHHGVQLTGDTRTRGDHFARAAQVAGGHSSFFAGLVLRGGRGFQAGTLKTIIDNHMDKAMQALRRDLRVAGDS